MPEARAAKLLEAEPLSMLGAAAVLWRLVAVASRAQVLEQPQVEGSVLVHLATAPKAARPRAQTMHQCA